MSLPPQVIHVKRKRTEEGPVPSLLRIEHTTKRHRSDAFLYRRHDPAEAAALVAKRVAAEAEGTVMLRPPTIQSPGPGDKKHKKHGTSTSAAAPVTTTPSKGKPADTTTSFVSSYDDGSKTEPSSSARKTSTSAPATPATTAAAEPRRFHLSRDSLMAAHSSVTSVLGVSGVAGVRKRMRYGGSGHNTAEPAAVFVERSKRRRAGETAVQKLRKAHHGGKASGGPGKAVVADHIVLSQDSTDAPAALPKRPGRRGLASATASTGTSTPTTEAATAAASTSGTATEVADVTDTTTRPGATPVLPPSLSNRQWDTNMDQLTREMNDYTLQIIGHNLAKMEETARASDTMHETDRERNEMSRLANERRRAAYAKYKPKAPSARYAERHGRETGPVHGHESDADSTDRIQDEMDEGADGGGSGSGSETDEDDYVTETYVRIPGHEAAKVHAAVAGAGGDAAAVPGTVGLLVFDNEPDLEFFYGVEEDSEVEFEDDEDENAENYYTHDYPEDEVSSDDEFDRDAYHYRTGNASDMEEFVDSDVEGEEDNGEPGNGFLPNMRLTKPGDL